MIKLISIYVVAIFFIIINSIYADEYITSMENEILTLNKQIIDIQMQYKLNDERIPPWQEARIVEIRYDMDMMKFSISLKRRNLLPKKYEPVISDGYPELEDNPFLVLYLD